MTWSDVAGMLIAAPFVAVGLYAAWRFVDPLGRGEFAGKVIGGTMAYKTCPDCGSRVYNLGCSWCNEADYIEEQSHFDSLPDEYASGNDDDPPKFSEIVPE